MESREKRDFLAILLLFRELIDNFEDSAESYELIEEMIVLRLSALIERALDGMQIDFQRAMELLQGDDIDLTEREVMERDRVLAAFDNLIDFAAASQFAMLQELPRKIKRKDMLEYEEVCRKYNLLYAKVENEQVLYAGVIAAFWLAIPSQSYIVYNTQNDERVRELHQSFDGLSFKKNEFPPELIPPIEWGCRCYLTEDNFGAVAGNAPLVNVEQNPIFKESLATCGRIFTDTHPYFQHKLPAEIKAIVKRLKTKLCKR